MSSIPIQSPAFYNPATWHHGVVYRQRFNLRRRAGPSSGHAVTFNEEELLYPSPAGFEWPRPQILKPSRQDVWQMYDAPTAPSSPVGSRASSPLPEVGELLTPAMVANSGPQEHDNTEVPKYRTRHREKAKLPVVAGSNPPPTLKWNVKTMIWHQQLMATCTDDAQRAILLCGLDPLMQSHDEYLAGVDAANTTANNHILVDDDDADEAEVEDTLFPNDQVMSDTSADEFHDALTAALVSAIQTTPSGSSSSSSARGKGKRKLDDEDGPGDTEEEESHLAKIARKSEDVEAARYRKAAPPLRRRVRKSPSLALGGTLSVTEATGDLVSTIYFSASKRCLHEMQGPKFSSSSRVQPIPLRRSARIQDASDLALGSNGKQAVSQVFVREFVLCIFLPLTNITSTPKRLLPRPEDR